MDLLVQNSSCEWNQVIACALSCLTFFLAKCSQVLSSWRHRSVVPWLLWQVTLLSRSAARLPLHASRDGLLSDLYSWLLGRKVQSTCMFLSWHMLAFLLVTRLPLVGSSESSGLVFCKPAIPIGKVGGFYFPLFLSLLAINCLFSRQPSLWCKMEFCCGFGLYSHDDS